MSVSLHFNLLCPLYFPDRMAKSEMKLGIYEFEWSGGKFPVEFRSDGVWFACTKMKMQQ